MDILEKIRAYIKADFLKYDRVEKIESLVKRIWNFIRDLVSFIIIIVVAVPMFFVVLIGDITVNPSKYFNNFDEE